MTTNELWIEYDRLCDLAELAAQTDPLASYKWAERLQAARELAVASEADDRRKVEEYWAGEARCDDWLDEQSMYTDLRYGG
jgi:hypothetical protein